jgi:hypothetical protein
MKDIDMHHRRQKDEPAMVSPRVAGKELLNFEAIRFQRVEHDLLRKIKEPLNASLRENAEQ